MTNLFSATLVLFLIMNPIGNTVNFANLVKNLDPKKHLWILSREMLLALGLMLIFNFLGEEIFYIFGIGETAVQITTGVILFLVALRILFSDEESRHPKPPEGELFLVPLATPMIAGPSLLATIMLYARMEASIWVMLAAILIAWGITFVILLNAQFLNRLLGQSWLAASERLVGLVLILLGIQRFLEGIRLFILSQ